MGVKDLMAFLKVKCPHVFHTSAQQSVADVWIDTPLIVMAAAKRAESDNLDPLVVVCSSLQRVAMQAKAMQQEGHTLHWVFDGSSRSEKARTVSKRADANTVFTKRMNEKVLMELQDDLEIAERVVASASKPAAAPSFRHVFDKAKSVCAELGNVHIAVHDSEEFIALHMKDGDVALTADSDALPFGCSHIVQHFGSSKETWILLKDVLQGLKMNLQQFRTFCVLLGTDFNDRLFRCGPAKAFSSVSSETFSLQQFAKDNKASEEWLQAALRSLEIFTSLPS